MTATSLSALGRSWQNQQQNTALRTKLYRLTDELSTGRIADLGRALGPDLGRVAFLDRSLAVGDGLLRSAKSWGSMLATAQASLAQLEGFRGELANQVISGTLSGTENEIGNVALAARTAFEDMVNALNVRFGDTGLFSGRDTDGAALVAPATMLADLELVVAGAATAADLIARVDQWFDDPGGPFETAGYNGDAGGFLSRPIDDTDTSTLDVRADDPAIRDLLKTVAITALAPDSGASLPLAEQRLVLDTMADPLLTLSSDLIDLAARVGRQEQRTAEAVARIEARQTSLGILRNDLTSADPFATATALEETQALLETHYLVASRLSGLSLARYL